MTMGTPQSITRQEPKSSAQGQGVIEGFCALKAELREALAPHGVDVRPRVLLGSGWKEVLLCW